MSNIEDELRAAGYTPIPLIVGGGLTFNGWIVPEQRKGYLVPVAPSTAPAEYHGYCTVCGCNAAECGGPTDVGDLDPDTDACGCWDDEAGEPAC